MSIFPKIRRFTFLLPIAGIVLLLLISKPSTSRPIPDENTIKTAGWKTYKNDEFRFSFKYPEGQLSNITVSKNDLGATTLRQLGQRKNDTHSNPNLYNVVFEAGAIKYNGRFEELIDNKLETKHLERKRIVLKGTLGWNITNVDKKNEAYFSYNIFKRGNIVYNFALLSDDPILIKANEELLNTILTTVTFY